MIENANFCDGCGVATELRSGENVTPPTNNKQVIQSNGARSDSAANVFVLSFLAALISAGIFIGLAFVFRDVEFDWRGLVINREFGTSSYIMFGLAGVSFLYYLIVGGKLASRISSTSIQVCATGIEGRAVHADVSFAFIIFVGFGWNKARLVSFDITYDKITSIDLMDKTIVINAQGTRYRVFVSDNQNVRDIINNNIRG